MIFTYKCKRCERIFLADPHTRNGLLRLCQRCLPPEELDIELE